MTQFEPFEFVPGAKKTLGSCAEIRNDWGEVIKLLSYNRIDPRPMFSQIVPLDDLENALHELKNDKEISRMFVNPEATGRVIF